MKCHGPKTNLIGRRDARGMIVLVLAGFLAAVAALVVMLATLSRVEIRQGALTNAEARARHLAVFALDRALADLQRNAGADGSVTARARRLDANAGNPWWTGSWDEEGYFQGWLVSGPGGAMPAQIDGAMRIWTVAGDDGDLKYSDSNGVPGVELAFLNDPDQRVVAYKVSAPDDASGAWAYWIADEGVKADATSGVAAVAASADVAGRNGLEWMTGGIGTFDGDGPEEGMLERLGRTVGREELALVSWRTGRNAVGPTWVRRRFHDVTVRSRGLTTAPGSGGWQREVLFDLGIGPAPSVIPLSGPILSDEGFENGPVWEQVAAFLRRGDVSAGVPLNPDVASDRNLGVFPVPVRVVWLARARLGPVDTDTAAIRVEVVPMVIVFNPWSAPMTAAAGTFAPAGIEERRLRVFVPGEVDPIHEVPWSDLPGMPLRFAVDLEPGGARLTTASNGDSEIELDAGNGNAWRGTLSTAEWMIPWNGESEAPDIFLGLEFEGLTGDASGWELRLESAGDWVYRAREGAVSPGSNKENPGDWLVFEWENASLRSVFDRVDGLESSRGSWWNPGGLPASGVRVRATPDLRFLLERHPLVDASVAGNWKVELAPGIPGWGAFESPSTDHPVLSAARLQHLPVFSLGPVAGPYFPGNSGGLNSDNAGAVRRLTELFWDRYYFAGRPPDHLGWGGRLRRIHLSELGADGLVRLRIHGAFNVNSDSVDAWTAILMSAQGRIDAESRPAAAPFSRRVSTPPFWAQSENAPTGVFAGERALSLDETRALAQAIVESMRGRPPFLRISEFVLGRHGEPAGPIDMALADSSVGVHAHIGSDVPAEHPGHVTGRDILQRIGPFLRVRSDTFLIRAYGEAPSDRGNNRPPHRRWCEAIVERTPEFVDRAQLPDTPPELWNETNRTYGRRFVVIDFRWLEQDEL